MNDQTNQTGDELKKQRICGRTGCDRRAVYLAGLLVRRNDQDRGLQTILDLPLCPACARKIRVSDVLSDEGWLKIRDGLRQSGIEVVRSLCRLFTSPIDECPEVFRNRYETGDKR